MWNANAHYYPVVVASLSGAARVLDAGCGDGTLCAELIHAGAQHVVGLDLDAAVLARARERHAGHGIGWVRGSLLDVPVEAESFDAVVSVAALHHLDAVQGLARLAELVRPGGTVVVIGIAANEWRDLPLAALATVARWVLGRVHGRRDHSAPQCWPPPLTYRQMKTLSARVLPGVRYRRLLLGRYSLVWRKP